MDGYPDLPDELYKFFPLLRIINRPTILIAPTIS